MTRPRRTWIGAISVLATAALLASCESQADQQAPPTTATSPAASSAASGTPSAASSSSAATALASTAEPPSAPPTTPPAATPAAPAPAPAQPVVPGGLVTDADIAQATAAVAAMSVSDQAGMVVMANSAQAVGTDLVERLHLGGVILMGSKGAIDGTESGTPEEVLAVTQQLQSQVPASQTGAPLLIATDQEYGLVIRMVNGFTNFPGATELSAIADTDAAAAATQKVTAAAGAELLAVGINVDFAPDADVLPRVGESNMDGRSFGTDPTRNGQLVAAAVRGYQTAGVAATLKHFPGIGRLAADTHKSLPSLDVTCDEWNAVEAVPMQAGVDAGVALVMTGHVLIPAVSDTDLPSSISSAVVNELLRGTGTAGCEGLNFTGVTISDSFEMAPISQSYTPGEAAWRALVAGQDLVLMPTDPEEAVAGIIAAAGDGSLPAEVLKQAAIRVYALRLALARAPQPGLGVVGSPEHEAIAADARAAG